MFITCLNGDTIVKPCVRGSKKEDKYHPLYISSFKKVLSKNFTTKPVLQFTHGFSIPQKAWICTRLAVFKIRFSTSFFKVKIEAVPSDLNRTTVLHLPSEKNSIKNLVYIREAAKKKIWGRTSKKNFYEAQKNSEKNVTTKLDH